MIDLEKALINPALVFHSPQEVLDCVDISDQDKIKILRQWEYDAREMAVAEEENMPGNGNELLRDILKGLSKLGVKIDPEHSGGSKQGG